MKNWKTTLSGIGVILAAVGNALHDYLGTGTLDVGVTFAAIVAGIGLIHAADSAAPNTPSNGIGTVNTR